MHPLDKKYFGPGPSAISIRYWNGGEIVNGYIRKQICAKSYLVTDGLHFKRVRLAQTTALAQYCNGESTPPDSDYSLIDGLATIVATRSGIHYINRITTKQAFTTEGLFSKWNIGSAPNGELLINGVETLVLRDLLTSSINFPVNTDFSVYLRNITPGSSVTATSSDGTPLTIGSLHLHGKFTQVGNPTLTFIETLAGATGSPRTSTYQVNVNPTVALAALSIDPDTATEDRAFFGAVLGKTAGSTIAATSNDGTVLTVYGGMVTGIFTSPGEKTISLVETLGAETRISTEVVTVS